MFTLTVIGKYGPFPKMGCATSSYLISLDDKNIVIDMGSGTFSQLIGHIETDEIDSVIFTHLHGDHMADALVFQYALQVLGLAPVNVYLPNEPGDAYNILNNSMYLNTIDIDASKSIKLFDAEISFLKTIHPVACYAVKIKYDDKTFVFSGDTIFDENLINFARDCDVFLCDSAVTEENHSDTLPHPSAKQAAMMAKQANAKRLLLTHISPLEDETDIFVEAKSICDLCVVVEEGKTYYI